MMTGKGGMAVGPIDREKFGSFVAELRKEKGFTQQELAEKLFVSNKAVSKWERGQSLPDIGLLTPLADLLGVTVAELLKGERMEGETLDTCEVKELVGQAVRFSTEEQEKKQRTSKLWRLAWVVCTLAALGETVFLRLGGASWAELGDNVLLVDVLCILFGFWLCWLIREKLPAYYDENKISFYGDGVFRMNLPGVRFNNSNWPHIVKVMRVWMLALPLVFPPVYWLLRGNWDILGLPVTLLACLGFFIPAVAAGRKYQ